MSYPYRIVTVAVVLGIALLAAGCASASSGATGVPGGTGSATEIPPSGGSADSGPPPLPDSSGPTTPALVPITPAPGRRERVAQWRLAGQADGGRQLLVDVTVGGPPCDTVTGVDVAETPATVTVTVHAGRLASASCPPGAAGSLATARVAAQLTQPLGDRELLGGAS